MAYAVEETQVVMCLTMDYGQLAAEQEITASAAFAKHYNLPHRLISLPFLREISPAAIVKNTDEIPEPNSDSLSDQELATINTAKLWVPNRNALFINIAAAYAESSGADLVVTGFNKEEATTFPDNSYEFVQAMNTTLSYSTMNKIRLISYTQRMNKEDILQLGQRLSLPMQYIWSCYRGEPKMCGKCISCLRLLRAAKTVGIDPSFFAF